jgi:hypothetical protein
MVMPSKRPSNGGLRLMPCLEQWATSLRRSPQHEEATGGRLEVKLHGTGVLVSAFESLEACGKGVFEAVHHPDAFATRLDAGLQPSSALSGSGTIPGK